MASLKTTYLGLDIDNPIVVSSCGLTDSLDKLKKIEKAGAGAVVLKSLFEEQIKNKSNVLFDVNTSKNSYPEAEDYINAYVKANDLDKYLNLIREAKAEINIPIIASINCVSSEGWIDFAKQIEEAGADALEVNVFVLPIDKFKESSDYEDIYFNVVRNLKKTINIPISLKIGSYFTNITSVVSKLHSFGAEGIVLFNRFFEPDIDIHNLSIVSAERLSYPSEIRKSLRWVGMLSDSKSKLDIAASTGVHDYSGVVKLLLAGAQAVQVCSVIYQEGLDAIGEMKKDLSSWMEDQDFKSIDDFRAKLSYANTKDAVLYERSQFMKYFSDAKEITY